MNDSELIKNYEKYMTEVNNKIDILLKEMSSLHEKINELSKDKSTKKDEEHYITEEELILNIDNGIFDPNLEGKKVELNEGNQTHEWLIIRVNSDSYDLWYNGSIGGARWKGAYTGRYWINNSYNDIKYIRGFCNSYKSNLSSSIRSKLKSGLNANCGSDTVVILSASQLGYTDTDYLNDDNSVIPYFNSNAGRKIGIYYWTSSAYSADSDVLWRVNPDGTFCYGYYGSNDAVVPAIRLG